MTDVVLFEELSTACGRRFGVATLNAPSALNSLSLAMVRALMPALRRWEADPEVVGVLLQGAGDKAFCAGGDLRELYASLREVGGTVSTYARGFFSEEYTLDYLLHTFGKPLVCWGHGIVMGGGIGLMAGASHRVVTPRSRLAMPEISIGLFPDVGGSWLLRRMPGRVGLFLALTGAPLDAADALFCGLADVASTAERRPDLLAAIREARFDGSVRDHHVLVSRLLAQGSPELPESKVHRHLARIDELMAGDDLHAIANRLRGLESDDPWLRSAATTFTKGSPTSAALSFELWRRAEALPLADVFRLEYDVALGCCDHADFIEGVRALLIDKDRTPRWNPASLEDVPAELVKDHFRPRYEGAHPLATLGAETG